MSKPRRQRERKERKVGQGSGRTPSRIQRTGDDVLSSCNLNSVYLARTSTLLKPEISNLPNTLINHTLDDR